MQIDFEVFDVGTGRVCLCVPAVFFDYFEINISI